jgi:hypothetical protein
MTLDRSISRPSLWTCICRTLGVHRMLDKWQAVLGPKALLIAENLCIQRVMRQDNLLCLRKRQFVHVTTDWQHGWPVVPNRWCSQALISSGRRTLCPPADHAEVDLIKE